MTIDIESNTNFKIYTPPKIAKEMVERSLELYFDGDYSISKFEALRCLDLSCGNGNLLLPLLEAIMRLYKEKLGEVSYNKQWITGYDIDEVAISSCRSKINRFLEEKKIQGEINIHVKNSLIEKISDKFHIILGNPPYFGEKNNKDIFKDMKTFEFGRKNYEGKMDYAYFFIARGIDLLEEGGILTYITTNYWFKADHAKKIREKIKNNTTFRYIHNYNKSVFEDAVGQHNVVFSLEKGKHKKTIEIIDENEKYEILEGDKLYNYKDKIILAQEEELKKLRSLYKNRTHFLGELLNINQGIVSGYDKAFVFDSYDKDFRRYLKPFYKNKDINLYSHSENKYWILYLDHKVKLDKKLNSHLISFKERLSRRREAKSGAINWWELQWTREEDIFKFPKIIGRQRSKINKFAYSENEFYGSADIYYLTPKSKDVNLFYLLGYLNSDTFYEWFKYNGKVKGRNLELYATPLKETPVYYTNNRSELDYIEKLVKQQIENYTNEAQVLINNYFKTNKN
jgi:adenine-specific DNA-methyltransferase